ncbi:MAG: recombinase family protein [Planctomycetes bacterium]|nr:recombinase family protein [Planctomycetota bacterium]
MTAIPKPVPCAIYTRKSHAEGLEMEFNSLDAQREAAEAYIASQRGEGLYVLPDRYDDGGYTGGNTERPALQRLLRDIGDGKVGAIVTYKVDRLSRSLLDFAKLIEVFERRHVSFISVTQQFNSATSMGRLTLNVLLFFAQFEREVIGERIRVLLFFAQFEREVIGERIRVLLFFAQFEREVIGERIRDKIAMARARGKNTGGVPPLGYDVVNRKLAVNDAEAETVRHIFNRFAQLGSATKLARELAAGGIRTKAWTTVKGRVRTGRTINKFQIYRILQNRKYIGQICHGDKVYDGEHEPIIDRELWERVQAVFAGNRHERSNANRASTPAMLRGILKCGHCGGSMQATYTRKNGRAYRYYVCVQAAKMGYDACPVKSASAGDMEEAVAGQARALLRDPAMVAGAIRAIEAEDTPHDPKETAKAVHNLNAVWDELFPAERARIVQLLFERIDLRPDGLNLFPHPNGLAALAREVAAIPSA